MTILAIDVGTFESGWCLIKSDTSLQPLMFGKDENERVRKLISDWTPEVVVIEKLVSYGRNVGNEVLETCVWVGRLAQYAEDHNIPVEYIKRLEEKRAICGTPTANDSMIRNALIAQFAKHDLKNGKGTKAKPDFFYGFRADMWQAFAVGITYLMKKGEMK